MAKDILRNDISELLEMIRDQYNIISSYEGKIPQIEMDIIMSNIRKVYDDFFELNKLNQKYKAEILHEETAQQAPSAGTAKPALKDTLQEPPAIKKETAPVKTIREIARQKETSKATSKKTPVADLFAGTDNIPIADKFKEEKKSLHDRIASEKKEKTIAETILNPVADLRTGIGVNDRFLFINELFGGSMQDYLSAIDDINSQTSREAAIKRIWEIQEERKWDNNSEALARLLGFIDRRFM